ncbi:hypothetical protein [Sorangium sp. So ce1000]|uniref:hypothetical protein n=1 Tax=Sorangium sp. So ce1000 TaxID=3133325 RepID=UPI003F63AB78
MSLLNSLHLAGVAEDGVAALAHPAVEEPGRQRDGLRAGTQALYRHSAGTGLPPGKIAKLFQIARAWAETEDALDRRIAEAEALPLEGWDAEAYAAYRGDDPDLSPLTGLSQHLVALEFERTWGAIRRLLGPAEMDALERWGQAEVLAHMETISPHSARIPPESRSLS